MSARLDAMIEARRRAETMARMRTLARVGAASRYAAGAGAVAAEERCDLCHMTIPDDHRHLLHLAERRIVCACEACWAMRSGDPDYRPAGMRTLWLEGFDCDDALWGRLRVPIGLAFLMRTTVTDGALAFYPSPAGATESELPDGAWEALVERNPILAGLDPDAEALIINRLADPPEYAIAPIDQCYALVGLVKSRWEGISGGDALVLAVPEFFAALRARSAPPREVR